MAIDDFETSLLGVATRLSGAAGAEVFREVARAIAALVGVEIVMVGLAREDNGAIMIDTVAACFDGELVDNFSYPLAGTPCESVVGREFGFYASGVQDFFDDPHLKNLGIDGYAAFPLISASGEPLGIIAALSRRPISNSQRVESLLRLLAERVVAEVQRERSAAALREAEASYRAIFDAAEDPIFVHDSDTMAVVDVNAKASEEYGYSRDEFLQLSVQDFCSGESNYTGDEAARLIEAARRDGLVQFEWHRKNKDGSLHWDEVRLKCATIDGLPRILAFTREITARKHAEQARCELEQCLRQAQKMEAIGQLTGGIAHDFNNILTSVLGYISLAVEHLPTAPEAQIVRYLQRARRSGDRARELIQQMLTYSRGGRGTPRPLHVYNMVEEVLNVMEPIFPASIRIDVDIPRDLPQVALEPTHAAQALINLCVNSRDAMDGQGRLSIRAGLRHMDKEFCASCKQSLSGTYIDIQVEDTGAGIDPVVLDRIFEPFFSTKSKGKGSGMGLATTHGIVHEYDGHLYVESRIGKGTSVHLLVPPLTGSLADSVPKVEPVSLETVPLLRGHVLVVEDNADVVEFMRDLLSSWGLEVTTFRDSLQARDRVAADPTAFGLALLDQTMPGLTGIELTAQLLRANPKLPIVLYTGYCDVLDEAGAVAAGAKALLRKPIANDLLRALLLAHLPRA